MYGIPKKKTTEMYVEIVAKCVQSCSLQIKQKKKRLEVHKLFSIFYIYIYLSFFIIYIILKL